VFRSALTLALILLGLPLRAGNLGLSGAPLLVYDRLGNAVSVSNRPMGKGSSVQVTSFNRMQGMNWSQSHFDGFEEMATSATTDADGNVYVTGFRTVEGGKAFWLLKYSAAGDRLWERADVATNCVSVSVLANDQGESWIGGSCAVQDTFPVRLIHFNSAGDVLWGQNYVGGLRNYVKAMNYDYLGRLSVSVMVSHGNYNDAPTSLRTVVYDGAGGQLAVY
jgi:hypothetical protein